LSLGATEFFKDGEINCPFLFIDFVWRIIELDDGINAGMKLLDRFLARTFGKTSLLQRLRLLEWWWK
jgi:hypothetical protein